uniref:C-type lectin domain-containing protein n=1 Tax=Denticeps clupeoides TaxID=299321 RepID=A0AAY4C1G0_9TELE
MCSFFFFYNLHCNVIIRFSGLSFILCLCVFLVLQDIQNYMQIREYCRKVLINVCRNNAGGIYVINSTGRTWTEAQIYCRQHYTDLAIIRNRKDNQNFTSQLTGYTWIGLYRDWVWSDQNNSTYRNWTAGRPLNNKASCAVADISQGGTWMDKDCGARFPFICYKGEI